MANDWNAYWQEGVRYLEICERAFPAKKAFTPEILFNLSGIAIEKLFMAYMMSRRALPENHTIRDLVRAAETLEALPPQFKHDLERMDRFMGLCSIMPVNVPVPTEADVPEFLGLAAQVKTWVEERLAPGKTLA